MRKKDAWKWAALGGLIVIALMFGMELAASGIGRVYGPLDQVGASTGEAELPAAGGAPEAAAGYRSAEIGVQRQPAPAGTEQAAADAQSGWLPPADAGAAGQQLPGMETGRIADSGYASTGIVPVLPARTHEPSVNRLADGAAGLLQQGASGGIRLVVKLFDALTD